MKKILPLILLVPCVAFGANSHMKASTATITKAGTSLTVKNTVAVKGTVVDETGAPLAGVTVVVKGTTNGTQTDVNGKFTLNVSPGQVLQISYIGYVKKEITVGDNTTLNISLTADAKSLNEVVVTALGIVKTQASLSYDQQTVSGKELEVSKTPSFINSLDGKVSGLQITQSSSGAGGSTKVVLRGSKSIYGSSNVLYVIDGVPLNSITSAQPSGVFSYAPDGGDGISNINPDDIASISVLKGASASALYGSAAENGVVLITTKKGTAGKTTITLNTNTTFDKAVLVPKLQSEYGRGSSDTTRTSGINSWGGKISGTSEQPTDFFQQGVTSINSFTLSTGTEKNQTFISYANTHATGIEPGNKLNKNNITVHNTAKMLNDKMTVDMNVSYIFQTANDRPAVGTYFNPLTSVYLFPRGVDFNQYKTFEHFDATRNVNLPNWIVPYDVPGAGGDILQNPYWIQQRNPRTDGINRLLATVSGKYQFTDWLSLQGRVSLDKANLTSDQKLYAGSTTLLSGKNGSYAYTSNATNQVYSDLLLNANKDISKDFNINGTLGASIQDNQNSSLGYGGHLGKIDNFFNAKNLDLTAGYPFTQTNNTEAQTQSLFATVDFGYRKYLFLDLTARNDWSSALAYTNGFSFFYPSIGLSDVLSSMVQMPDFISYSKFRVSYTDAGNSIPAFVSSPAQYDLSGGFLGLNLTQPIGTLKPEITHSFEAGMEWRFINDHISFDATYYHTNTLNQLFNVPTTVASGGYSSQYINGGNVKNEGFEGSLGYQGDISSDIKWNSTFTFSLNRSKVISLYTDPQTGPKNFFTFANSSDSYAVIAKVGRPFEEVYAKDFKRDASGNVIMAGGKPVLQDFPNGSLDYKDLGSPDPRFMLGWSNNFKFKQFDLAFTIDGRFGGVVVDETGAFLDAYGVSQASADARDKTDGSPEAITAVQNYYQAKGGRGGALATYAYSATNIRFREASIGYTLPGSVFNNKVSDLRIAFTGRNLFFFYLKAPYDPETTLATDNTLQGVDLFGQPSVRSLGFSVSVKF